MSRTIIKFTSPFNSNAVFDAFGKFMYRENFEFVQKNYSADGKLLGTVKNGKFYNSSGKEISESEMDALLPQ